MTKYFQKSLIAHLSGFLILILSHILWSLGEYGSASGGDIGVIIFWAALFLIIFYLIFILLPRKLIEKAVRNSNLLLFSFGFAIYALIGFIILIGWIFLNSNFIGVFIDAFFYGLAFGVTFHKLANQNNVLKAKNIAILTSLPVVIFFIYIFLLPKIFPTFAFKIVPAKTREQILKKTLGNFKQGDDFNQLKKALPGYFANSGCDFSTSALMEDFQYSLVVQNCKIIKISSGPRKNKNGLKEMVVETPIKNK